MLVPKHPQEFAVMATFNNVNRSASVEVSEEKLPDNKLSPTELQKVRDMGFKLGNDDPYDGIDIYRLVDVDKRLEHVRNIIQYVHPSSGKGLREEIMKYVNGSGRLLIMHACNVYSIGGGNCWGFAFCLLGGKKHTSHFASYEDVEAAYAAASVEEGVKQEKFYISLSAFTDGIAPMIVAKILAFYTFLYEMEVPAAAAGHAGGAVEGDADGPAPIELLRTIWNGYFYTRRTEEKLVHNFKITIGSITELIVLREDVDFVLSVPDDIGNFTVAYHEESVLGKISEAMSAEARRLEISAERERIRAERSAAIAARYREEAATAAHLVRVATSRGDEEAVTRYRTEHASFVAASDTAEVEATQARDVSVGLTTRASLMASGSEEATDRVTSLRSGETVRLAAIPTRALSESSHPVPPPVAPLRRGVPVPEDKEDEYVGRTVLPPVIPRAPSAPSALRAPHTGFSYGFPRTTIGPRGRLGPLPHESNDAPHTEEDSDMGEHEAEA